jgi:hypothetical protein
MLAAYLADSALVIPTSHHQPMQAAACCPHRTTCSAQLARAVMALVLSSSCLNLRCTCPCSQVGGLMKRLDIGEGSYSQELEEDYEVLAAMDQVMGLALANEEKCQEFRQQYLK